MIGLADRQRELHFFFVEINKPAISSKWQVEDDFVKLMKQLKSSIDKQVE
jgi:hypothetical protein